MARGRRGQPAACRIRPAPGSAVTAARGDDAAVILVNSPTSVTGRRVQREGGDSVDNGGQSGAWELQQIGDARDRVHAGRGR